MTYTETKERNGKRYFYRVLSVRKGNKVSKKRKYLGLNLTKDKLTEKEKEADKKLKKEKINTELKKIIPKIKSVLKKYKIKKAGIFGSYATGNQKKNSDIDILVEYPKGMGFKFVNIEYELEDKLNKEVDLVTYDSINHLLRKRILEEEIKII